MSDKYTRSAKGKDCQIRIPGICNFDESTTVFCHIGGGGMGRKRSSIHGAYGCSACHDAVDGRIPATVLERMDYRLAHFEGMVRTQEIMAKDGVLVL